MVECGSHPPRVFVSYCHSSLSTPRVEDLARKLLASGVDAVLDVWELRPGHDLFVFMERAVLDPTITHVLLMCDRVYRDRSNGRSGGVGVETELIVPAVSTASHQSKFIPIVLEYEDGRPWA